MSFRPRFTCQLGDSGIAKQLEAGSYRARVDESLNGIAKLDSAQHFQLGSGRAGNLVLTTDVVCMFGNQE
jgi:hypothetical protein